MSNVSKEFMTLKLKYRVVTETNADWISQLSENELVFWSWINHSGYFSAI